MITEKLTNVKETRGLFSPRMDYEQWTPLGRGDPLKNDPTYDYVPPVLERVHYWIEPSLRKPDPPMPGDKQKTEILLLGVSSKKPSTGGTSVADSRRDTYEPFLKFVDGPIFQSSYQRIARPNFSTYFPTSFYSSKSKPDKNMYLSKGEQRVPYTMLVPPPPPKKAVESIHSMQKPVPTYSKPMLNITTQKSMINETSTTPSSVTVQESNLIYQSSSLGGLSNWNDGKNDFAEPSSQVTWKTPLKNDTDIAMSLNIKLSPEKFLNFHLNNTRSQNNLTLLYNVSSSDSSREDIDSSGIMYKGQVSDGDMDIASTYVNIGKAEAQMDSSSGFGISSVSIEPPQIMVRQPPVIINARPSSIISKPMSPLTMHTLQTMQTMQPPPVSKPLESKYTSSNSLFSVLRKEITKQFIPTTTKFIPTPLPEIIIQTTTVPTVPSSTTAALTTDPLFKHYKQPSEPLKGPMYLIIQGHSKVKTYGPSKQIHGINVQETNEILTSGEKNKYTVKHLHNFKKETNVDEQHVREGRSSNLQSLKHVVKTGLGAINFNDFENNNRRNDNDVQETELSVSYDVSSRKDTSNQKYHKGIVEAARTIKDDDVQFKQ